MDREAREALRQLAERDDEHLNLYGPEVVALLDELAAREQRIARLKRAASDYMTLHGTRYFPSGATPANCESLRVLTELLSVLDSEETQ